MIFENQNRGGREGKRTDLRGDYLVGTRTQRVCPERIEVFTSFLSKSLAPPHITRTQVSAFNPLGLLLVPTLIRLAGSDPTCPGLLLHPAQWGRSSSLGGTTRGHLHRASATGTWGRELPPEVWTLGVPRVLSPFQSIVLISAKVTSLETLLCFLSFRVTSRP